MPLVFSISKSIISLALTVSTMLVFLLTLTFLSPLYAQQVNFKEKSFDFGVAPQGVTLTHDFQISNTGNADLIIRKISPACGCMAAVADSAVINPNGSSYLRVHFDTTGFVGKKTKTIRVYTNDSSNSSQVLEIKAEIVPKISSIPESISIEEIPLGVGASQEIRLKRAEGIEGKILQAISKSPLVSVTTDKNKDNIILKIKPEVPVGKYRTRISIKIDSKEVPLINVPVFFEVVGNLRVDPPILNFGIVRLDSDEVIKKVKVSSRDGRVISNLTGISIENPLITVSQDIVPGKDYVVLNVKLKPNNKTIVRTPIKFNVAEDKSDYQIPVFGVIDEE